MHFKKGEWFVILFNFLYLIPFTIFYFAKLDYEFLAYIGVLVLIGIVVLGTLRKSNLDLLALWGLSIWGFLHMAGGSLRIGEGVLYGLRLIQIFDGGADFFILKMDQLIHFYGFAVAAIVVFQILAPHFKNREKFGLLIFAAWIGSMGLGSLNEVVEFLAFVMIENTGVGSLYNTGLDLVFNMFGALAGAFFASYWYKRKNERTKKNLV